MTVTIKEQLDFIVRVGNHLVVKLLSSPFDQIMAVQQHLREELETIPELFGEDVQERMNDEGSRGSETDVQEAMLDILRYVIRNAEAISTLDLLEAGKYSDTLFDNLWLALDQSNIEYNEPDFD